MVVVSHDRRFLDKIVDRLVVFPGAGRRPADGRVRRLPGQLRRMGAQAARGEAARPPDQARRRPPKPRRTASAAAAGGRAP